MPRADDDDDGLVGGGKSSSTKNNRSRRPPPTLLVGDPSDHADGHDRNKSRNFNNQLSPDDAASTAAGGGPGGYFGFSAATPVLSPAASPHAGNSPASGNSPADGSGAGAPLSPSSRRGRKTMTLMVGGAAALDTTWDSK